MGALEGHNAPIMSVACSADGVLLATGSIDCTVRIWKLDSCEVQCVIEVFVQRIAASDVGSLGSYGCSARSRVQPRFECNRMLLPREWSW